MKEKWVRINTIEGYENVKDCYWISNSDEDKIMNKDTGKQLKPWLNGKGYKAVNLMTIDDKTRKCRVHVMKAKAFLFGPNPIGANVVRHLNDCKTDNKISNLAWGTMSDNIFDSIRNGHFNYEGAIRGAKMGGKVSGKINGTVTGAKNGKKTSKPVRCIETGIIYPSAREASRQTGIHNISNCCRGEYKTAGGYHWEFVNKEVNNNDMECE